jgi:outer membrane lipoprotein-sorting protein
VKKTVLFLLIALVFVAGCTANLNNKPNLKFAIINQAITATGKTTLDLYKSHKITSEDVKKVYQMLSTASYMVDQAQQLYQGNATQVSNADLILTEASALIQQARAYLRAKEGGK